MAELPPDAPEERPRHVPAFADWRVWVHFFVGHPKRALVTAACIFTVWGMFHPDAVANMIQRLLSAIFGAIYAAIAPIIPSAIITLIVFWGFWCILRGLKGGNRH